MGCIALVRFIAKATNLSRRIQLRELVSLRFLREIHHFLWTDPQIIGNTVDAGWNCRDHALVAGLLCESFGFKALLIHGEALFVRGATTKSASISYSQRPHQWVLVEGIGAVDLSIKPEFNNAGDNFRLPIKSVFANDSHPRGRARIFFLEDAALFARADSELLQHGSHSTAVYFTREAEHPHDGHITHSAGWIRSALTVWLDAEYGDPCDLYAALLLHLHAFLLGNVSSLANFSFCESWKRIAQSRENSIARAKSLLQPVPFEFAGR